MNETADFMIISPVSNLRSTIGLLGVCDPGRKRSLTPVSSVGPQQQWLFGSRGWRRQWKGRRGRKILGSIPLRSRDQSEQGILLPSASICTEAIKISKIYQRAKLWVPQNLLLVFTALPYCFPPPIICAFSPLSLQYILVLNPFFP